MSEYRWEDLPNYPWAGCLGGAFRRIGACETEYATHAASYVADRLQQFDDEWRTMVKSVQWYYYYGGEATPQRRIAYVIGRLDELARALVRAWDGYVAPPGERAILRELYAASERVRASSP